MLKIKISCSKQGKEENISEINKNQYLKVANSDYEKGEYENSPLINIMWSYALKSSEILALRFEKLRFWR